MITEQRYRDVIHRWVAALGAKDWDAFDRVVDETVTSDYVYHMAGQDPVCGAEGIKKYLHSVFESIPDPRETIEDVFVAEDKGACRLTLRRTDPVTGRRQRTTVLTISHLKNGKFAEEWDLVGAWEDEA